VEGPFAPSLGGLRIFDQEARLQAFAAFCQRNSPSAPPADSDWRGRCSSAFATMAILSVLFSLVARQLGNLAQAIFGWSVTALFGQLPSAKRTALSVAVLLSLVWPLLGVGLFVPAVAAWSIAAVPMHKWVGDRPIRIATVVLVFAIPLAVGLITRWVAPARTRKGGTLKMVICGYPLTVGYATSCLVTAVTVPIIKAMSLMRRWTDEHVYVQPREGSYQLALDDLEAACRAAGVTTVRQPVPRAMSVSTRIVRWFARGALDAILEADPQMLKAKEVEVYLYPADLLLRGEPKITARVRARISTALLERHAYLVANVEAQHIEDQLRGVWDSIDARGGEGPSPHDQLRDIARQLDTTDMPYDQWATLDRTLRRLEKDSGAPGREAEEDHTENITSGRAGGGSSHTDAPAA
jgi:hypothetical protein